MSRVVIAPDGIVEERWTTLADVDAPPAGARVLVSLARWSRDRDALLRREGRVGVVLEPDDDPAAIAPDLPSLGLVAVRFPHFTDGRGYSTARLLRERHGYDGELRALGDVARDVLFYLSRVGFDTFALREGEDVGDALAAFDDFSEAYQACVDRPQPLFRRRSAPTAVPR